MAGGLLGVPPTFGSVADSVLDVVPAAPAGSKPNAFGFGVLQPAKGGSRDFFGSVGSIILELPVNRAMRSLPSGEEYVILKVGVE